MDAVVVTLPGKRADIHTLHLFSMQYPIYMFLSEPFPTMPLLKILLRGGPILESAEYLGLGIDNLAISLVAEVPQITHYTILLYLLLPPYSM